METPKKSHLWHLDADQKNDATTSSPLKALPSPKTPVRSTFYSDDDESDEMESPKFPHLIPIYRRTPDEYDLGGVRIGWDDGFDCTSFQDDDCVPENKSKKNKKSRSFSKRRHRSFFRSNYFNSTTDSPSPSSCASPNNTALHEELNNYLECILNCLSAKKKNRQLMKAKMEASCSASSSTENNNVGFLLDDSADDEMMMLCSQAVEQKIAADAINSNSTINEPTKSTASNSLLINGISPLKDINNSTNNNVYHHASKKFKSVQSKLFGEEQKDNCKLPCHTITSSTANKSENNSSSSTSTSVTNCKKDDSSSSFFDTLASDDDFFSGIDFLEIEQQIMAGVKETTTVSATQNCYKQPSTNADKQLENKPVLSSHASTSNSSSSSVLWRRSTSTSSIVNKQQQSVQQPKQFNNVIGTTNNSRNDNAKTTTTTTTTRYCTPAEIEAKRDRARRTLLLKFKSKNRSVL